MPSRRPVQRLEDILENIARIRSYTKGMTTERFAADHKTVDAVERCFERISEAVRKLGGGFDDAYPDLDLPALRRFGSVLRHDYENILPVYLWGYVERRLVGLEDMARRELDARPGGSERGPVLNGLQTRRRGVRDGGV